MADNLTEAEQKMLKEYREAEAERRAKLDDADEVTIKFGDRSFSGPFRRAREVARSWGFDLEPPAAGTESKEDEGRTVRFGRRTG